MPDQNACPRLLMIVPTRGRPGNASALIEAWQATTGPEADLLFAVDDDDPELPAYRALGVKMVVGPRLRFAGTLNEVATRLDVTDKYFAVGYCGDDHRPRTVGWAVRFLDELERLRTGMVYGNDLIHGAGLPTSIAMTTNIVTALGCMVPGGLVHLFADNAHLELGRAIGRITYLPDVVIEHMHPLVGKAPEDDLYRLNNSNEQFAADKHRFEDWKRFQMAADVGRLAHLIATTERPRG